MSRAEPVLGCAPTAEAWGPILTHFPERTAPHQSFKASPHLGALHGAEVPRAPDNKCSR